MKKEVIANELYNHLTDYEHEGMNALGELDGSGISSINLTSSNEIHIELEDGRNVIVDFTIKSLGKTNTY